MKRLLEGGDSSLGSLTQLLESAEPLEPRPFAKPALKARITRALEAGAGARRLALRPKLLGAGGLLIAATAAAAGYSLLTGRTAAPPVSPATPIPDSAAPVSPLVVASGQQVAPAAPVASVTPPAPPEPVADADAHREPAPVAPPSLKRNVDKPRPGEDPTQVAEAVRALRKQGDFARAQALLDHYLKNNPRGALAEDALALSIEAAAARKDPRAADYARRYLARYPNGRFRAVAERALAR
jgi:hypothetical protein